MLPEWWLRIDEFDLFPPPQQRPKCEFGFQPGQRRAQAVVRSQTECQMGVRTSAQIEIVWPCELVGVAIGGSQKRHDTVSGEDPLATDFEGLGGGTRLVLNRAVVAQQFFHRRGDFRGVFAQALQLRGMTQQRQ